MATEALATFSVNLEHFQLPDTVIKAAVRSFCNWVGCTIGGSHHEAVTTARNALSSLFGSPTSTILGNNNNGKRKTDAQHAALLNGIASHVHDYDDTHLATIIHPTGPIASALLALTETIPRPISGKTFLLALTAGIEAECKVGLAVYPAHYDVGWHITSTTGSIGAAVACAKLLGLSTTQTQHAIGIAATQVTGLREMFGTQTKSFHAGRAAQNGLLAALLAEKGFTSSLQALEAKRGWVNVVSTSQHLDEQMATLGKTWEVERNSFKPFPCGIVVHPVIDACVQLHHKLSQQGQGQFNVEQIESVEATVHPLVLELTGKSKPKDGLEGKFSVYHGAAIGLALGKATPAQYEDGVVNDPAIIAVREKVHVTVDKEMPSDAAEIVVTLGTTDESGERRKGRKEKVFVEHAVGSVNVPMTDEQLTRKFVDQCEGVLGREGAERASGLVWEVAVWEDVREAVGRL